MRFKTHAEAEAVAAEWRAKVSAHATAVFTYTVEGSVME